MHTRLYDQLKACAIAHGILQPDGTYNAGCRAGPLADSVRMTLADYEAMMLDAKRVPLVETAARMHTADDLEIDADAMVSWGDGGDWVQAWVWVAAPDSDDEGGRRMTTTDKLAAALRDAAARLDTIGTRASCAPNDDEEAAGRELTKIMHDAYGMRDRLREALAEYDAERDNDAGREGSVALVHAYAHGAANGGSVDWSNLNQAHDLACVDLGPERVAAIVAMYAEGDDE